jgi:hypothetical protein
MAVYNGNALDALRGWLTRNDTFDPGVVGPVVTTTESWATGTLANGAETAVSSSAVSVLAANANRKKLILQNTGSNAVRIGTTGVTATTGVRLAAGATLVIDMPHCPTNAILAIRESADSTVLAQEVT